MSLRNPGHTADELAARKAENAAFWIYDQSGRLNTSTWAHPERWRPNSLGKTLRSEFYKQFLPEAKSVVGHGRDPRYVEVKKACMEWARSKYGRSKRASRFGERLELIALDALNASSALAYTDVVIAASEILAVRKRGLATRNTMPLRTLLRVHSLSAESRRAVIKEVREARKDRVVDLLEEFFSSRSPYWRRFLDRQGRVRKTKLPSLTDARVNLVEGFLRPEKMLWWRGPHIDGLSFTRSEAYGLAARCLKAAFPKHKQVRGLTGATLKHTYLYHKRLRARRGGPPSRYGQV